jgi:hypothetical protein
MSIGGFAMKTLLAGAVAAATIVVLAGAAQAAEKNACQWTSFDWACGDGNVVTQHVSETTGPSMQITPIQTLDPARDARLADPSRPH